LVKQVIWIKKNDVKGSFCLINRIEDYLNVTNRYDKTFLLFSGN